MNHAQTNIWHTPSPPLTNKTNKNDHRKFHSHNRALENLDSNAVPEIVQSRNNPRDERTSIRQPTAVPPSKSGNTVESFTSQTAARVMMQRMSRLGNLHVWTKENNKAISSKLETNNNQSISNKFHRPLPSPRSQGKAQLQVATQVLHFIDRELSVVGHPYNGTVEDTGTFHVAKLQVYREAFQALVNASGSGPWQKLLYRIRREYESAIESLDERVHSIPSLELAIETLQSNHKAEKLEIQRLHDTQLRNLESRLEVIREREQEGSLRLQQEVANNAVAKETIAKLEKTAKELRLSNTHLIAGIKHHEVEKLKLDTQNEKLKREHSIICQEFEKLRIDHEQTIAEIVALRMAENNTLKAGIAKKQLKDSVVRLSSEVESLKSKLQAAETRTLKCDQLEIDLAAAQQCLKQMEDELNTVKGSCTPRPDWETILEGAPELEWQNSSSQTIAKTIAARLANGGVTRNRAQRKLSSATPSVNVENNTSSSNADDLVSGSRGSVSNKVQSSDARGISNGTTHGSRRRSSLANTVSVQSSRRYSSRQRGSASYDFKLRNGNARENDELHPMRTAAERQQGLAVCEALQSRELQTAEVSSAARAPMIDGLGTSSSVPKYLQIEGPVRNLELSKRDTERLVKDCWMQKNKERDSSHLESFFYSYLLRRFRNHSEAVEWGYNMVAALERYKYDSDCDLFLKVLRHEADERLQWEQAEMLHEFQQALFKVDAEKNKGTATKSLPRQDFIRVMHEFFPRKPIENTRKLEKVLFFESPGVLVNYEQLFEEDRDGNQGEFCETLREQFVEEELADVEHETDHISNSSSATLT